MDANDRWMAAAAWVGWACGGPLLPVVLLAVSWSKRGSLARQHALAATVMWTAALAVWLPVFFFGIALRADDPATGAVIVAVVLGAATLAVSIGGVVTALRAPLAGHS